MDRRKFLEMGACAALGGSGLPGSIARAAMAKGGGGPARVKVDIYSRQLQWLRTADEVATAAAEMGYDGVDITVRPYPGHVDPARVSQDLPPFVKTIRQHGLEVRAITCPIVDAESPHAEEILQTASGLGIHNYWWGTFRYQNGVGIMQQLEALKPRVGKLADLNRKYGMTAMYHTYAGSTLVSGPLWDMLYVLRGNDPAYVGLHYDICHMTNAGGLGTWETSLRAAGPYVRGVAVKDALIDRTPDGRWYPRYVPLGQGEVELPPFVGILQEINFTGPIEIQAEYPLGGANDGADKITVPRDAVLGAMGKDLQVLRSALAQPANVPVKDPNLPDGYQPPL